MSETKDATKLDTIDSPTRKFSIQSASSLGNPASPSKQASSFRFSFRKHGSTLSADNANDSPRSKIDRKMGLAWNRDTRLSHHQWGPGMFFVIYLAETDKLRIVDGPPTLLTPIHDAIVKNWSKGIQEEKELETGVYQYKLVGTPWSSDCGAESRRLVVGLLQSLYLEGFHLYTSTDMLLGGGHKDTWVLTPHDGRVRVAEWFSVSFGGSDTVVLTDAPDDIIEPIYAAIKRWNAKMDPVQKMSQERVVEIQMKGTPWTGHADQAHRCRRLVSWMLKAMFNRGCMLYTSTNITKGDSKDTWVMRRADHSFVGGAVLSPRSVNSGADAITHTDPQSHSFTSLTNLTAVSCRRCNAPVGVSGSCSSGPHLSDGNGHCKFCLSSPTQPNWQAFPCPGAPHTWESPHGLHTAGSMSQLSPRRSSWTGSLSNTSNSNSMRMSPTRLDSSSTLSRQGNKIPGSSNRLSPSRQDSMARGPGGQSPRRGTSPQLNRQGTMPGKPKPRPQSPQGAGRPSPPREATYVVSLDKPAANPLVNIILEECKDNDKTESVPSKTN
eukprot:NODE_1727_length_1834_cov_121.997662_g1465_i0.p1 GENE.NODE_1727_length_1834_cov_121.997662_g1465_i0~~NODE_1727_length_1834_cov_121.997662_g1465_i0.p1  ORF type:complete len:569 (-),score=92.62 NODE_1727_length_1834_cov_121.997662_g1465_i0:127-1779(-)